MFVCWRAFVAKQYEWSVNICLNILESLTKTAHEAHSGFDPNDDTIPRRCQINMLNAIEHCLMLYAFVPLTSKIDKQIHAQLNNTLRANIKYLAPTLRDKTRNFGRVVQFCKDHNIVI